MTDQDQSRHKTCPDCGQTFVISESEAVWFLDRDMTLPKRCKPCRRLRRLQQDTGGAAVRGGG